MSPAELLQRLIRFDTTNPPGNEAECIHFIATLLHDAGIETRIVARDTSRPNLIARLAGEGRAPGLLMQGHVDVVTTQGQEWTYPPFAACIADGFIWGRGALDMKGGVAMMLAAFLRTHAAGVPRGDLMLAVLSDEEAGSTYGARYLVHEHPSLFNGIRYAVGEFGGFTFEIAGRRFYPVQVAEKGICQMRLHLHGHAGHGALSARGGVTADVARILRTLDEKRLPVHVTEAAQLMLNAIARAVPPATRMVMRALLSPSLTDRMLNVLGERGEVFDPLLHNTANATGISAGERINVIPAHATLDIDGRLLPGMTSADMIAELRALLGVDFEVEMLADEPSPATLDMGLFPTLADIVRKADPGGKPIPYLLGASTDARFFSRLGIQCHGFLPMTLPAGFNFSRTIHAADERIPVEALEFGTHALEEVVRRM
ncbi:MAG: M20/M25/M40 family metallo-hydrolase [Bacteroidetes bacterium]|nr:M20/M25/M40 family metallo-hydrolase [Bacteroidota bacterium]